jgi:hypothetical protein
MIGILAYGSLIANPGWEIQKYTERVMCCIETPFAVEYARRSENRAFAPTLVPVPKGKGIPVQAAIFVLKGGTIMQLAYNILYRREINQIGDLKKEYHRPQDHAPKKMQIGQLNNFNNIDVVLYAAFEANFEQILNEKICDQQKADLLCDAACDSLNSETIVSCKDGIHYLNDAMQSGIITHLTDQYQKAILKRAGNDINDLQTARLIIAKSKGLFP